MFTTNIHATEFRARNYPAKHGTFATVEIHDGTSSTANVFMNTPEACDELIKAAAAAKSMLLGETSEPVPAPGPAPEHTPTCLSPKPGTSTSCQRPAGHAGGHKNFAKDDYWPQDTSADDEDDRLAAAADEALDALGDAHAGTDAS